MEAALHDSLHEHMHVAVDSEHDVGNAEGCYENHFIDSYGSVKVFSQIVIPIIQIVFVVAASTKPYEPSEDINYDIDRQIILRSNDILLVI